MAETVSVWFCVRCGRAQRFTHQAGDSATVLAHLAAAEHEARQGNRKVNRCETDPALIAIDRDSTDITKLRERVWPDGES